MNDLDGRIRAAVRDTARLPRDEDVMASVATKRTRRRTVRRLEASALAVAAVVALVVGSVVVLGGGDDHTTRIAAPPAPSRTPKVRIVGPHGRADARVHLVGLDPDEGYVRGPLLVQGDAVTAAAYDRSGDSYTFPPSRIVRFTLRGRVLDRVDLKGEIRSLAEGEGARWALTRDKEVLAPPDPEFRVKRIGPNGDVASNPVPRGEQPAGDIVAGGGAVWLPVTDGVLRFDTATGAFEGKVPLSTVADQRSVAVLGKGAFVTDGAVLRRLDPSRDVADELTGSTAPPGLEYRDIAPSRELAWALGADASGRTFVWQVGYCCDTGRVFPTTEVPDARSFVTVGGVTWLELSIDGQPALRRYPEPPVRLATIRSRNVSDGVMTPVDARSAVVVSRGSVFRVGLNG